MESFLDYCEREEYYHSSIRQSYSYTTWLPSSIVHRLRTGQLPIDIDHSQPCDKARGLVVLRAKQALQAIHKSKVNMIKQVQSGNNFGLLPLSLTQGSLPMAAAVKTSSTPFHLALSEDPFVGKSSDADHIAALRGFTVPARRGKKRPREEPVKIRGPPSPTLDAPRRSTRLSSRQVDHGEKPPSPDPPAQEGAETVSITDIDFPDVVDHTEVKDHAGESKSHRQDGTGIVEGAVSQKTTAIHTPEKSFVITRPRKDSEDSALSDALDVPTPSCFGGSTIGTPRKQRRMESDSPCLRLSTPLGPEATPIMVTSPEEVNTVVAVESPAVEQTSKRQRTAMDTRTTPTSTTSKVNMIDISAFQKQQNEASPSNTHTPGTVDPKHFIERLQAYDLYSVTTARVLQNHRAQQHSSERAQAMFDYLRKPADGPMSSDFTPNLNILPTERDQTAAAETYGNVVPFETGSRNSTSLDVQYRPPAHPNGYIQSSAPYTAQDSAQDLHATRIRYTDYDPRLETLDHATGYIPTNHMHSAPAGHVDSHQHGPVHSTRTAPYFPDQNSFETYRRQLTHQYQCLQRQISENQIRERQIQEQQLPTPASMTHAHAGRLINPSLLSLQQDTSTRSPAQSPGQSPAFGQHGFSSIEHLPLFEGIE
ncbi:hypothetical protein CAC42_5752 [Sphaceloma murrayae]|uniref:Uncharacterized protein n=1 Tax=Sphaceloma murrayae TaxID=2082308 RepID=A0A2K1QZ23_9PEZI|nr:hypothetical protein CAC42_5752 [Sphaceloma murrayae]